MVVLQIIDSLEAGGAERVAVNYANGLANLISGSHICVTRKEGPLNEALKDNVGYIFLEKKSVLDISAILNLRKYIKVHKIDVLHAHSTSFFIAVLMKFFMPKLRIVWHDHYGNSEFLDERPYKALRLFSRFFTSIISVNLNLKQWAKLKLNCQNISYIKNYPVLVKSTSNETVLEGKEGFRVVCLANLREQKNHLMLLEAFKIVVENYPEWTLHCVGKNFNDSYADLVDNKIESLNLSSHVYFYNSKPDILNILEQSQMGLLVSKSEGLPLTLLEYGLTGLPVITTDVGDCGSLISDDSLGILIKDLKAENIARAIIKFIEDKKYALECAKNYKQKVEQEYSENSILNRVIKIYKSK